MTNDLPTRLQAMFHSGEISGFISARMPTEKLSTGWIEHGLLLKGFTGKLEDKENQEQLIIPADRFSRLIRDLEGVTQPFVGLLIMGNRGLAEPKFCVLVYDMYGKNDESLLTVAFRTKNLGLHEITRVIARYVLNHDYSTTPIDSDLDYVEQLKMDASVGDVQNLLTLKTPAAKQNITEWIHESINSVNDTEGVIAAAGNLKRLSKFAILFSRWLTGLDLFKRDENNLAATLLMYNDRTEFCLWDTPQKLASFFTMKRNDAKDMIRRYLTSMWSGSEDLAISYAHSPKVVVGKKVKSQNDEQKSRNKATQQLDHTLLRQIKTRVETMEARLQDIENTPRDKTVNFDQSMFLIQNKLVDTVDRLESLVVQLSELEERIKRISKSAG